MESTSHQTDAADTAAESGYNDHAEDRRRLERESMRNWYLLASICISSTIGLLLAVMPTLRTSLQAYWPGERTDITIIAGLGGLIVVLVLQLTYHQIKITRSRFRVQGMQNRASEFQKQNAIRMHALLNVTRMMGAVADPMRLFQGITSTCLEVFNCQQASLMLVSEDRKNLEMKAASGHLDMTKLKGVTQPVGEGIAGYVAKTRESLLLGENIDVSNYPSLDVGKRGLYAAMVVPIIVRDELVGVLNISSRSRGINYSEHDLQALDVFAVNAGTCIHQAERTEWMRQTIKGYRIRNGERHEVQKV
ncbi:MAG: transcriptional regulator with GAF, ATPase, and Fis domain [Candidatus Krumholzibacteriia bacterium]|jgi:transcriptional regulator with GAF, ATPase, and Fis domain